MDSLFFLLWEILYESLCPSVCIRNLYCYCFASNSPRPLSCERTSPVMDRILRHIFIYWVTQKLAQIYTANHATIPIRICKITVQICGNFWVTQYITHQTNRELSSSETWFLRRPSGPPPPPRYVTRYMTSLQCNQGCRFGAGTAGAGADRDQLGRSRGLLSRSGATKCVDSISNPGLHWPEPVQLEPEPPLASTAPVPTPSRNLLQPGLQIWSRNPLESDPPLASAAPGPLSTAAQRQKILEL